MTHTASTNHPIDKDRERRTLLESRLTAEGGIQQEGFSDFNTNQQQQQQQQHATTTSTRRHNGTQKRIRPAGSDSSDSDNNNNNNNDDNDDDDDDDDDENPMDVIEVVRVDDNTLDVLSDSSTNSHSLALHNSNSSSHQPTNRSRPTPQSLSSPSRVSTTMVWTRSHIHCFARVDTILSMVLHGFVRPNRLSILLSAGPTRGQRKAQTTQLVLTRRRFQNH
jgi:hypothetical protein